MALPLPWDFRSEKIDPATVGDRLQDVFDVLALAAPDTGGQSVRIRTGTVSLSFAAATNSGEVSVNHGLGTTPCTSGVIV